MGAPRSASAHDALGDVVDIALKVVEDIDRGRVRDLPAARDRIEAVREMASDAYDRHLGAERRLVLTTEAATLRQWAEVVRPYSAAAADRLLRDAAAADAKLGHALPAAGASFDLSPCPTRTPALGSES